MPRSSDKSTLSSRFSSVEREPENLLSPAAWTLQVGVEGESIAIIDIELSSNMEYTSTAVRRGASTGVIPIHHISVGDGDGAGSGNADNADNYIVSSSSSPYWSRTTKWTKEETVKWHVICANNKRRPEGSRERNIHHDKVTKELSQTWKKEETLQWHVICANNKRRPEGSGERNIHHDKVKK